MGIWEDYLCELSLYAYDGKCQRGSSHHPQQTLLQISQLWGLSVLEKAVPNPHNRQTQCPIPTVSYPTQVRILFSPKNFNTLYSPIMWTFTETKIQRNVVSDLFSLLYLTCPCTFFLIYIQVIEFWIKIFLGMAQLVHEEYGPNHSRPISVRPWS